MSASRNRRGAFRRAGISDLPHGGFAVDQRRSDNIPRWWMMGLSCPFTIAYVCEPRLDFVLLVVHWILIREFGWTVLIVTITFSSCFHLAAFTPNIKAVFR
jgi:hypothetical protein